MTSKKKVFTSADVPMLVSETFAAAFPLTRFRDLDHVPEKRAREPSSARGPGAAHP